MTKAKTTTTRPASEATAPKSATTAEPKMKRPRGKAASSDKGGAAPTASIDPAETPSETPITSAIPDTYSKPPRQTKAALLRARLAEPGGVSLAALMAATGWQAHTLRAALSGLRKDGLTLTRRREGEDTIYAIAPGGVVADTATADRTDAPGDAAKDYRTSPATATEPPGDAYVAEGSPAPSDASPALQSTGTAA
jgi:hypothetical protein